MSNELSDYDSAKELDGKVVNIIGIVDDLKKKVTKSNSMLGFLTLEDRFGSVTVMLFNAMLEKFAPLLEEGKILKVTGRVNLRENGDNRNAEIICDNIVEIGEEEKNFTPPTAQKSHDEGLYIRVDSLNSEEYASALEIIKNYSGEYSVKVVVNSTKRIENSACKYKVSNSAELVDTLKILLGEKNVKFVANEY
jgi:DNA polymerase-3 subunit alpha